MARLPMLLVAWLGQLLQELVDGRCPGRLEFAGYGHVATVGADWEAPGSRASVAQVEQRLAVAGEDEIVPERILRPRLGSRTYLADACNGSTIPDKPQFLALQLLGKTLRYTTDISGAGCGCNAKLYLAPLQQNTQRSKCHDYYCDAKGLCGVKCAEIDVQEANQHAWHSTLHTAVDLPGLAKGVGGSVSGPWNETDYGIGGRCIDTSKPFEVLVSFPIHSTNWKLAAVNVTLAQEGHDCALELWHDRYGVHGKDGLAELSEVLEAGVTPIISYWASDDLKWLDSAGKCDPKAKSHCSSTIGFRGFSVEEIHRKPPKCQRCPVGHCDQELDGACRWFAGKWLKGLESYHCRVTDCKDVPKGRNVSNCWHWHDVPYYSVSDRYYPCRDAEQQSPPPSNRVTPFIWAANALHGNDDRREDRLSPTPSATERLSPTPSAPEQLSHTDGSDPQTPPERPDKATHPSDGRLPILLVLAMVAAGLVALRGAIFAYERLVLKKGPDLLQYAAFPCDVLTHDTFGQCATAMACGFDLKSLGTSASVTSARQATEDPDVSEQQTQQATPANV